MDPITTTPSTNASAAATSQLGLSGDFDTFLTLLTAQIQNQDPLDPMDTDQLTDQLTQYSQVEQQIRTNSLLETLLANEGGSSTSALLGYLGRSIEVPGAVGALEDGRAEWRYAIPEGTESVDLVVLDAAGAEVARFAGETQAGAHSFVWNGQTGDDRAEDGVYQLQVVAADSAGAPLSSEASALLNVNAVETGPEGAVLVTPAGRVAIENVISVLA